MPDVADELRALEQERIDAFLAKDVETLQRLHADDFHMINPGGQQLGKHDYINGIGAGFIAYTLWEVDGTISVLAGGDIAVLRYRSQVQLSVQGEAQPPQRFWQTEVYEKRDGRWQAVMSQSTRIAT